MDPETREYFEALRLEFAALREEMGARFRGIDSRFDAVDRRIGTEHETTRRLFHVVAEDLRFGLVHLAFADVRRELAELRGRGAAP